MWGGEWGTGSGGVLACAGTAGGSVTDEDACDASHAHLAKQQPLRNIGLLAIAALSMLLAACSSSRTTLSHTPTRVPNGSARSTELSGNPLFPGWYADPEGAVLQGRYWIYPTYSAPYDKQLCFDAFSSTNLVDWKWHRHIAEKKDFAWVRRAMWAPAIVENNGKYFLFFGANDIQKNEEVGGIGIGVSNAPAGPFKDYLGKPLIDAIHNGAQPIDQTVFHDKDGSWYIIYGGWGHCNIAKLSPDFRSLLTFPDGSTFKEITPEGYVEGPLMFIRNGKYYFMWSEGGWTGPDYCVAYAIADSPLGPFQRIGKILQQDANVATGAGHHGILRHPETDEFYIVYHRRPLGETDQNHRVVCIERMEFDDAGRIKPVKITFEGVVARLIK